MSDDTWIVIFWAVFAYCLGRGWLTGGSSTQSAYQPKPPEYLPKGETPAPPPRGGSGVPRP